MTEKPRQQVTVFVRVRKIVNGFPSGNSHVYPDNGRRYSKWRPFKAEVTSTDKLIVPIEQITRFYVGHTQFEYQFAYTTADRNKKDNFDRKNRYQKGKH